MIRIFYWLQSKVQGIEFKLAQKLEQRLNQPYASSIFYFGIISLNVYLVFWQVVTDLFKFFIVLLDDPGDSFNLFFRQRELRSCPFSYASYKKVRGRVRLFSAAGVTAIVIVSVTTSLVTNLLFGGKLPTWAATKSFAQSSWLGGQDSATTSAESLGWSKYFSASSSIRFLAGGGISLNSVLNSIFQNTDENTNDGFNLIGRSTSSTVILGAGTGASVKLDYSGTGLIGGHHFNNDGADFSGNNNNLAITNNAASVERVTNGGFEVNTNGWTINKGSNFTAVDTTHQCGIKGLTVMISAAGTTITIQQTVNLTNPGVLTYALTAPGPYSTLSVQVNGTPTTAVPAGTSTISFIFGASGGWTGVNTANNLDCVSIMDQPSAYTSSAKYSQALNSVSGQYGSYANPVTTGANWTMASFVNFPLTSTGLGSYNVLSQSTSSPSDYQVLVQKSNGHLGTMIGGVFRDASFDVTPLSGWHHLAAVGSGASTQFYIDGFLVGTAAGKSTADIKYIGNDSAGNQPWGGVDDFMIFNRVLSTGELLNIANSSGEYLRASYVLNATTTDNTSNITSLNQQGGWGYGATSSTMLNGLSGTSSSVQLAATVNGGTGAEGAYNCPSGTCSIASGTHNYTTFTIAAGATTTVTGTGGVTINTTGAVTVDGVLSLSGNIGGRGTGGTAGSGGGNGRAGAAGNNGTSGVASGGTGGEGQGWPAGGAGGNGGNYGGGGGGGSDSNIYAGGSYGGGGGGGSAYSGASDGGGGGGGILFLNGATQINIGSAGRIIANGGPGYGIGMFGGGGGGGGNITLKTLIINNSGLISAVGGNGGPGSGNGNGGQAGGGGGGNITIKTASGAAVSGVSVNGGTGFNSGTPGTTNFGSLPYAPSGTFISYIDGGSGVVWNWNSFSYSETAANASNISFKVIGKNTLGTPSAGEFDASPCGADNTTSGGSVALTAFCAPTDARYLYYRATLNSSADLLTTPTLDSVSANAVVYNYANYGTYTSGIIDTGAPVSAWDNLSWVKTGGQSVSFKIRSSNSSSTIGAASWGTATSTSGAPLVSLGAQNGHRFIQYQAMLSTSNSTSTPSLDNVTIGYNAFPSSAELISSPIDSGSFANMIGKLDWVESATSTTEQIKFQIRTATSTDGNPDVWSAWCGYDDSGAGCSGVNYFLSSHNNLTIPVGNPMNDGSGDQWFQYRVILESAGAIAPVLSSINLTYVANEPPIVSSVTAQQVTSSTDPSYGNVVINYSVQDIDSGTGLITPSYEYFDGSSWAPITLGLSSGATSATTTSTSTPIVHQVLWNASQQVQIERIANAKIRVIANDGEAARFSSSAVSSDYILDTTAPSITGNPTIVIITPLVANVATAQIGFSASDLSSIQVRYATTTSAFSNFSNADPSGWQDYANSTNFSVSNDPTTIHVQYRDAYNNHSATTSATSAETPQSFMIQDTTNLKDGLTDYRLFFAWKEVNLHQPSGDFAAYDIYRSTNDGQTFDFLYSSPSSTVNYFTDNNAPYSNATYYYVLTRDLNGNTSFQSPVVKAQADGIMNFGEGGGGAIPGASDMPPTIDQSTIGTSSIYTTQATIAWETNLPSDSLVYYQTTTGCDFSGAIAAGSASMRSEPSTLGVHTVTLSGLDSDTTYYFQVRSTGPTGLTATSTCVGDGYSFTTQAGPAIIPGSVSTANVGNTTIDIAWDTDQAADSYVVFSTSSDMSNSVELG
ncbi:hypothetical protein HGA34_02760, partial [Candidatus Falkowbacteria bacterium]|nr:hypothetical protein [Candidatus Falkowbacteria bacterium]